MNAVEVSGLKKSFRDGKNVMWALKGIDLKIRKGRVFGLLGPNGAGKTTMIYILSTMLLPTSGTAHVLGYDVVKQGNDVRERTGLCMGGTYFYWDMNPREILEYYGRLYGLKHAQLEKNKDELIDKLGIKGFDRKIFGSLSTGMRQKVAVAKAMINMPEVLFLDEPTAGLDVEVAIDVRDFIMDMLRERGMTAILTSHHMQEVEQMCKNVAIINNGGLVASGGISSIKKRLKVPDIIHFYLDKYPRDKLGFLEKMDGVMSCGVGDGLFISVDSGLKRMGAVARQLMARGLKINDMEISKASLEDVFLSIVGREGNRHAAARFGTRQGQVKQC